MKRIEFEDASHLSQTMISMLGDIGDDYPIITAYGKYEVIKDLFENIISDGRKIDGSICLEDFDATGYDKEFALYLTEDGVSIYKMFYDGEYFYEEPDIAFVHEECNSKMLKRIESKLAYEFAFVCEDTDDSCCDKCDCYDCDNRIRNNKLKCNESKSEKHVEYSKDDDGNLHGFTASKSDGDSYIGYSLYTSDKLSLRDIQSLLQEAGF